MNKVMILAILVAYKAFNDKSLTIRTNEYVVDGANIDNIDYEDIYDINDYEYPYNHINHGDLV